MSLPSSVSEFESKMLSAKQKARQAEADRQLLLNRVALLKREEERAWRKIQSTKSRAEEILQMRMEHEQQAAERESLRAREEARRKVDSEKAWRLEEAARRARRTQLESGLSKKKDDVQKVRSEAAKAREAIREQRLDSILTKQQKRLAVKRHEEELRARREKEQQDIIDQNRRNYDTKVQQQVLETQKQEKVVLKMEKKEMDLIQKLKKTQVMQQQAFQDLEHALNGELTQVQDASTFQKAASPIPTNKHHH